MVALECWPKHKQCMLSLGNRILMLIWFDLDVVVCARESCKFHKQTLEWRFLQSDLLPLLSMVIIISNSNFATAIASLCLFGRPTIQMGPLKSLVMIFRNNVAPIQSSRIKQRFQDIGSKLATTTTMIIIIIIIESVAGLWLKYCTLKREDDCFLVVIYLSLRSEKWPRRDSKNLNILQPFKSPSKANSKHQIAARSLQIANCKLCMLWYFKHKSPLDFMANMTLIDNFIYHHFN